MDPTPTAKSGPDEQTFVAAGLAKDPGQRPTPDLILQATTDNPAHWLWLSPPVSQLFQEMVMQQPGQLESQPHDSGLK
jgi:hypothetical protein